MSEKKFTYQGQLIRLADQPVQAATATEWGDVRDGSVYDIDPDLRLSVEIALAARRPLLLRGAPGSGKSSLAAYIARNQHARYYELVVTARTSAEDLLWSFDAIRKLSDAQVRQSDDPPLDDRNYVVPGVLWWAINPDSARLALRRSESTGAVDRRIEEPFEKINKGREQRRVTILIDELDKADPDVPNGLLVPIGSSEFRVKETGQLVGPPDDENDRLEQMLIVVTTNETRELPAAFVRRCVVHHLDHPGPEKLVAIARRHVKRWEPGPRPGDDNLFETVAERVKKLRDDPARADRRPPSTAEYLDAVRAARSLDVSVGDDEWEPIERAVLLKDKVDDERTAGRRRR